MHTLFHINMGGVGFGRGFQILIFLSFFFPIKTISKNNSPSNALCIEMERNALLRFKKELQDPSNRLSSWILEVDCCKWIGIHCDNSTGHVKKLDLSNVQYVKWPIEEEFISFRNSPLKGNLSNSILNLKYISHIDLSYNDFGGTQIPKFFRSLISLNHLVLRKSIFQGLIPHQLGNLSNLQRLDLRGTIPGSITSLGNLRKICISGNQISGPIPEHIGNLSSLEYLDLSSNELSGTLPESIGLLSSLKHLLIYDNHFEGIISEVHFANLRSLKYLVMSENNLTLSFSVGWEPPFNLISIELRSCNLGPRFPKWLKSQKNFYSISLSNAKIVDTVPDWFWNLSTSYEYLDLAYNKLSGKIPDFLLDASNTVICLRSNKFHGNLHRISSHVSQLDLSNNSFVGSMSHFLCHPISRNNRLMILHLQNNILSKHIPDCWTNWMLLETMNLDSNNLSGKLPSSMRFLINLEALHLRNNSFFGKIPHFLKNCSSLITLDLDLNAFHGKIPTWIGTNLSNLIFLGLRSNQFSGLIPNELCHLSYLQIMNIGNNNLIGSIPHCFGNFTAMASTRHKKYYFYSVSYHMYPDDQLPEIAYVIAKGEEFQYDKTLYLMTSMDLSHNNLSGEIPQEITNLVELKSMNLSGNSLRGNIPQQIGSMTNVESLDLSRNQLSGQIPQSISKLSSLSYLNLSYNHLLGPIPTSTQLQSFDPSSFLGNELCGLPLTNTRSTDKTTSNTENEDQAKEGDENFIDQWFYLSVAIGFVVGFWGIWGPLLISQTWRRTYFRHMSSLCHNFS
ncbi:receptor-like protein EIX2 [Benincasa hispida]|uniref:receptor-like protein EIX2 n=1 Tax=Benincasa hispida TaxID=102211 RepID=UPI0019018FBD|nr:receptor-like protein EIX2 [Benincasa hispida]